MSTDEGFPNYVVTTNEAGVGLYCFVMGFMAVSFLSIAPLVVWGRRQEKRRRAQLEEEDGDTYQGSGDHTGDTVPNQPTQDQPVGIFRETTPQTEGQGGIDRKKRSRKNSVGNILRELDRLATTRYPDNDPDFLSAMSGSIRSRQITPSTHASSSNPSNTPSAATTSRLHVRGSSTHPRTRVWDVGGRKWKYRRPIGRPDVMQQAFYAETQNMGTDIIPSTLDGQDTGATIVPLPPRGMPVSRGMSDVAGSVLTEDANEEEDIQETRAAFARQRQGSISSDNSFMRGTVVDDISPNDAADADDPGRTNSFEEVDAIEITCCCGPGAIWKPRTVMLGVDGLLEVAEPDGELKRMVGLGAPRTLGAVSECFYRAIMVCFVSQFIGTDAMVAYVLVTRLISFSDEVMGAITDAEGALCSYALGSGNFFAAGQYVQVALVVHMCLNGAVLTCWALFMDTVVEWFVSSPEIAALALAYTKIIVYYHVIQSASRAVSILFHLTGNESFETHFAIAESTLAVIVMASVVAVDSDASLETIAWIQVMISIVGFFVKSAYAAFRGWIHPFVGGLLFSFAFRNLASFRSLILTSMPLFVGTFLEYGEWTILMVFVQHLGPAEVATWCLLGVVWDILEASTEGIGEAAAVRVAYHLGNGNSEQARRASYKALFLSTVRSLVLTSFLFMFGKSITTWMTTDPTLQHLVNDTLTLVGIGNVCLSFAMMCWGLVGAQGRYRIATLMILVSRWLVTTPMALICVYGLLLDLDGVMGSVIVGYAMASTTLAYLLLRSDWGRLSRTLSEMNAFDDGGSEPGNTTQRDEPPPDEERAGGTVVESVDASDEHKIRQRVSL